MVVLVTSIVLVAVLAWVSRRLLGLPVGALRAAIAGLVGFVAVLIVGQALRATESGHLVAFFSAALGVPLIVAMIFIGRGCRRSGRPGRGSGGRPDVRMLVILVLLYMTNRPGVAHERDAD